MAEWDANRTSSFEVKGLSQVLADLRKLPEKIERNVVRGALRAGVRVFGAELGRRIPIRTGALAKSVKIRASNKKKMQPKVILSVGNQRAWYAHILERGAKAHDIRARAGFALNVGGVPRAWVRHPGIKPRYFLRDTFYAADDKAVEAFKIFLDKRMPRELGKLSRDAVKR